jgi:Tol biopolymer transport system component
VSPQSFASTPALSPHGKTVVTEIHRAEKGIHGQFFALDAASVTQTPFGSTGWDSRMSRWPPDDSEFLASAWKLGETEMPQIFFVTYPEGGYRKIMGDSNAYFDLDPTADGKTIAALRATRVSNVWIVRLEGKSRPKQLTFNASSASAVGSFVLAADETIAFNAAIDHDFQVWTSGPDEKTPRQITPGSNGEQVVGALPSGEFVISRSAADFTPHVVISAEASRGRLLPTTDTSRRSRPTTARSPISPFPIWKERHRRSA